jgi:hypothetical protein
MKPKRTWKVPSVHIVADNTTGVYVGSTVVADVAKLLCISATNADDGFCHRFFVEFQ